MVENIENIPEQPTFPKGLVEETGITVRETEPRPLPRGAEESASWLAALRERLAKIAHARKGV
ncbi:MAG: hypothetical protein ACOYT7_01275 [Patescibacteria group bacterium]